VVMPATDGARARRVDVANLLCCDDRQYRGRFAACQLADRPGATPPLLDDRRSFPTGSVGSRLYCTVCDLRFTDAATTTHVGCRYDSPYPCGYYGNPGKPYGCLMGMRRSTTETDSSVVGCPSRLMVQHRYYDVATTIRHRLCNSGRASYFKAAYVIPSIILRRSFDCRRKC
jgi:hypothetical protein